MKSQVTTEDTMSERKTHKVEPTKVEKDHLMAIMYYVKVKKSEYGGTSLVVGDQDNGQEIKISGKELIENSFSADLFEEEVKVSKTQAAELLVHSVNRPLTVSFLKQDGSERTLRGRLVKPEPLLGRSMMEDLDLPHTDKNRLRQVDHRTINFLVVDGVKYIVK